MQDDKRGKRQRLATDIIEKYSINIHRCIIDRAEQCYIDIIEFDIVLR